MQSLQDWPQRCNLGVLLGYSYRGVFRAAGWIRDSKLSPTSLWLSCSAEQIKQLGAAVPKKSVADVGIRILFGLKEWAQTAFPEAWASGPSESRGIPVAGHRMVRKAVSL